MRFIPAYAGNSTAATEVMYERPVHPRLRGELEYQGIVENATLGSSPLTRGTQTELVRARYSFRFIPAYAGNSLKDGINPSIHTLGI